MAPQIGTSWDIDNLSRREVTKSTDPDGLILEAWAQGFMVGAIVIMICITLANLKRGVILHKLILIEVCTYLNTKAFCSINSNIVASRRVTWYLHFQPCSYLRVVSVCYGNLPQYVMEPAQLHRMVEEQAVHGTEDKDLLPYNSHLGSTILGARDIRQLYIFQQYQ